LVVELGSERIGVVGGVVALSAEDVDELEVGLVEPASFTDGLEAQSNSSGRVGTVALVVLEGRDKVGVFRR
jgi:hypothetical protein